MKFNLNNTVVVYKIRKEHIPVLHLILSVFLQ